MRLSEVTHVTSEDLMVDLCPSPVLTEKLSEVNQTERNTTPLRSQVGLRIEASGLKIQL